MACLIGLSALAYGVSGYSAATGPVTAAITTQTTEKTSKSDNAEVANLHASVTAEQAKSAALQAFPGGQVSKVELEDEDGRSVYGADLTAADGTKYDVKVDAVSGAVIKSEPDGQDENEKEGDD